MRKKEKKIFEVKKVTKSEKIENNTPCLPSHGNCNPVPGCPPAKP